MATADAFRRALSEPAATGFRHRTHRIVGIDETLARVRPLARRMGITRIGNITGLDHIGIPVAVAIRPRSRSVAVSLGKGLTIGQAKVAALMEAVENYHAEDIADRCRWATPREMAADETAVDVERLCRTAKLLDAMVPIPWIQGYDLMQDAPCWVPAAVVQTDYAEPLKGSACFQVGSNGLACGNHLLEAVSAGLCELVERDAVSLWRGRSLRDSATSRLCRESIDDADCRVVLDRLDRAGMAIRLWSVTTETGIPAFICDIRPLPDSDTPVRRRFRGAACHPGRAIALLGAMTEAAQVRLTYISGGRDDLYPADYAEPETAEFTEALLDVFSQQTAPRLFADSPYCTATDLAGVVRWELDRLRQAGFDRVVAVDLTKTEFGIPVVRMIIPGLEGLFDDLGYVPGRRRQST